MWRTEGAYQIEYNGGVYTVVGIEAVKTMVSWLTEREWDAYRAREHRFAADIREPWATPVFDVTYPDGIVRKLTEHDLGRI